MATLPPNWTRYTTDDGKEYFHNTVTNTTQWERPAPEPPATDLGMMDVYKYEPSASEVSQTRSADGHLVEMQGLLGAASAESAGAVQLGATQLGNKEVPTGQFTSTVPAATSAASPAAGSGSGTSALGSIVGSAIVAGAMSAVTGGAANNNEASPGMFGWFLSSAQQLFDVSTHDVVQRLRLVLLPYPKPSIGDVSEELKARPDFYGPFWVATTAVLFLAATGNFAQLVEAGTHDGFKPNYSLVSIAATMIYGCLVAVPLVARVSIFASGEDVGSVDIRQLICVCGYALAPTIPISILSIVPMDGVRWLVTILGLAASLLFLRSQLLAGLAPKTPWLKWVLVVTPCIAQVIIYTTYRLHFFSRSKN